MDAAPIELNQELVAALRASEHIAALTGAGVSAESGVPTFRQAQTGLWARYDPQELATPQAFRQNPRLVWEWYTWRRELISQARPNPGHFALAEMERQVPRLTLITQNVDGLHRRAGSQAVIELHGNIFLTRCSQEDHIVGSWSDTGEIPPRCSACWAPLRPDVVWFGENIPPGRLEAAIEAAQSCDFFLSIGTSTLVQPAAALPFMAIKAGATVLEINPEDTPLTPCASFVLKSPAGLALPAIYQALRKT